MEDLRDPQPAPRPNPVGEHAQSRNPAIVVDAELAAPRLAVLPDVRGARRHHAEPAFGAPQQPPQLVVAERAVVVALPVRQRCEPHAIRRDGAAREDQGIEQGLERLGGRRHDPRSVLVPTHGSSEDPS
jgi:hypothetical protein